MEPLGALMMMVVQLLFMVAVVGGGLWFARHQRDGQQRRWSAIAQRHKFVLTPATWLSAPRMRGQIDGIETRVSVENRSQGKSSVPFTVVSAACPVSLPPGLKITREGYGDAILKVFGGQDIELGSHGLDPELRIKGLDEEAVRQVLTDPDVMPLLRTLIHAGAHSRIEHNRIRLEERGRGDIRLEQHITDTVGLAKALAAAVQRPWTDLATATGLDVAGVPGGVEISGQHEGLSVTGRVLVGRSDADPHTTIRVRLPEGLPKLGITLSERGEEGGLRLGDPVLDGLIRVHGADETQARALLTGPAAMQADLHGKLLAVVHGRPGSVVSGREVRVVGPGATASHAHELINDALALADALVSANQGMAAASTSSREGDEDAAARARAAIKARQGS